MVSFKEWILSETVSVYVHGHDYQSDINDLDSISNNIRTKVLDPLWNKLSEDQQEDVVRGGSYNHGMIAPDGDYYSDSRKQIINLYLEGWPQDMVRTIISGVRYFLDEMNVKYGQFENDTSNLFGGHVVRIPILSFKETENSPPLLNMTNMNAKTIFSDILKLPSDSYSGGYVNISPADLYRKIEELEKEHLDIHAQDPYASKKKDGALFFHGGISTERIMESLNKLKEIAKWALENHYDTIDVI